MGTDAALAAIEDKFKNILTEGSDFLTTQAINQPETAEEILAGFVRFAKAYPDHHLVREIAFDIRCIAERNGMIRQGVTALGEIGEAGISQIVEMTGSKEDREFIVDALARIQSKDALREIGRMGAQFSALKDYALNTLQAHPSEQSMRSIYGIAMESEKADKVDVIRRLLEMRRGFDDLGDDANAELCDDLSFSISKLSSMQSKQEIEGFLNLRQKFNAVADEKSVATSDLLIKSGFKGMVAPRLFLDTLADMDETGIASLNLLFERAVSEIPELAPLLSNAIAQALPIVEGLKDMQKRYDEKSLSL